MKVELRGCAAAQPTNLKQIKMHADETERRHGEGVIEQMVGEQKAGGTPT